MSTTIVVGAGKFSTKGFWYYQKCKRAFTDRSFATLLTKAQALDVKSMSVATGLILDRAVWVERNQKRLEARPETELKEGDKVVLWMAMGNICYKHTNGKLKSIK